MQGMGNVQDARREMTKTKEQLEEEKKISLSIRIKPLELDGMDGDALKEKASELWEVISWGTIPQTFLVSPQPLP